MASEYSDAKRELLEKYLQGEVAGRRSRVSLIPRRTLGEAIPLSHAQEQVWVHAQLAPQLPLYNEPVTIHYSGALNAHALEQSFNEILRRHEAWRTSFSVGDGGPVQTVHDTVSVSLRVIDLRNLPRAQREATALEIATADAREPFDLAKIPLFRAKLIRLEEHQYRLYLTLCHIIFDGVALYRVFLPELATLYKAYAAGKTSPLPELAIQYPDFACWERRTLTNEKLQKDLQYWREKLRAPLAETYLPGDHRPPRVRIFRGSMYPFRLRARLMKEVRDFSRREGISVFHALFAAFSALLRRYSGEERVPVGMVTAGRKCPQSETLLGYFLNTVVVPTDTSGDPSFRALAHRARNWTIEALDHERMPFEHLVRELPVQRDPGRNPLFQALFSLEPPLPSLDPQWRLTQMDVDTGTTKYDLYLELDDRGDEVLARFHYSTDLLERESIARMALHWKALLRSGIADPDLRVSALPLLSLRERRNLMRSWQGERVDYPAVCVHQLFEEQAARTPDAVAVVAEGKSLEYRKLNEEANRVAHLLLKRGLKPDALVGVCMDRGVAMVIALLGILKAGAAYLPLDPSLPEERLSYLLSDAKPVVIITDERSRRPRFGEDAIVLDSQCERIAHESKLNPPTDVAPNHRAYVIYTSGSTGLPKGVAVEHRSVVNFLSSMQRKPGISSDDVLLAVTTLSFDIAGLEIFLPLITGAQLVLAASTDVVDGTRLKDLLRNYKVSIMQATPASWRLLIEAGWEGRPNLKILCGGESLSRQLANELVPRGASVWNMYGPTETTIWSSMHRLNGREEDTIPIGRPIANTEIYVLDQKGQLVPPNVCGEIYIGGDGLARGYLNRPQLTNERFVSNSVVPAPASRLYRTGDLGRWNSRGELEYLGRIDTQIKLRGIRIELGEIESVLASYRGVRHAVVMVTGADQRQKTCAYIIFDNAHAKPSASELRRHVRRQLPAHMVPAEFWQIESVPLLPSGKVNRAALGVAKATLLVDEQSWITPRTQTEVQLAAIWSELLKIETIGVEQNFFELGGHSLLVLQMTARIRRNLGVEVPARNVFEAPTIAALAKDVEGLRALGVLTDSAGPRHAFDAGTTHRGIMVPHFDRLSAEDGC